MFFVELIEKFLNLSGLLPEHEHGFVLGETFFFIQPSLAPSLSCLSALPMMHCKPQMNENNTDKH